MNENLVENFTHIRNLFSEIQLRLNGTSSREQKLQNELAGMFAVTIAASYEGIVKETLVGYARQVHPKFHSYIELEFERMNSKISLDDLKQYSKRFGFIEPIEKGAQKPKTTFDRLLSESDKTVTNRLRSDLKKNYTNILEWRHAYAHQRLTLATFRDVYLSHRIAKHVIITFAKSFETPSSPNPYSKPPQGPVYSPILRADSQR